MLKHIAALGAIIALSATPSMAQSASHIAKAQKGVSCSGCNLFQADLAYRDITGANFAGARLRQSDMSLSTVTNGNFTGSDLSVANMFGARLNRSNLSRANLSGATLVGTYFGSSNLSGANLSGANLSGADLSIARGLTQSQLNKACGDRSTVLPRGMSIPRCR